MVWHCYAISSPNRESLFTTSRHLRQPWWCKPLLGVLNKQRNMPNIRRPQDDKVTTRLYRGHWFIRVCTANNTGGDEKWWHACYYVHVNTHACIDKIIYIYTYTYYMCSVDSRAGSFNWCWVCVAFIFGEATNRRWRLFEEIWYS